MSKSKHKKPIYVVVTGILTRNNQFLMTKRVHDDDRFHGKWQFPGGELEVNETVEECLHREIMEELGVAIIKPVLIPQILNQNERSDARIIIIPYLCKINYKLPQIVLDKEASEYAWLTLEEILNKDCLCGTKEIACAAYKLVRLS